MVQINDGDEPKKVPLVYYDTDGERHVVGNAAIQLNDGEVIALGQIFDGPKKELFVGGVNLEGFSLGPFRESPAENASRRLGPLSMKHRIHVTETNPDGEVRQCDRRDLHDPHEYQPDFGGYFNVFCPGNVGSQR